MASTPQQVGVAVGASWAARSSAVVRALEAAAGHPITGLGLTGAPLRTWLAGTSPPETGTLVYVLEMGGNTANVAPADIRAAYEKMARRGARVAFVLPPEWPATYSTAAARTATRRATMARAILAAGVPVINHGWKAESRHLRDSAHLNELGAREFAAAIVRSRPSGGSGAAVKWLGLAAAAAAALGWWLR